MRNTLKKIDSILSSKLIGNTIGMYPNILGLKGRIKLKTSGNQNSNDLIKEGFVDLGKVFSSRFADVLKFTLNELEQGKKQIKVNDKLINTKNLDVYKNPATLKILNGGKLVDFIFDDFQKSIKSKIDEYFSASSEICSILVWRNYTTEDPTLFSGDWHYDRRPTNWFRLFVLLENVDVDQGPFMFISKKESKKVTRGGFSRSDSNWQSDMNSDNRNSQIKKFIGKKGYGVAVDTQNLLHRAGVAIPGKTRDMCEIVFKI